MSLYEQWKEYAGKERGQAEYDNFWKDYFETEKKAYEEILESKNPVVEGKLEDLAARFEMDSNTVVGFVDGMNTSLVTPVDMDELKLDTELKLEIDFEKLYFNMLDAKADWLYNLPQWDGILSKEKRTEITKDFRRSKTAVSSKVGRNDPCPCGSGKKYKKCCGQ